jgi:hypothetical protein
LKAVTEKKQITYRGKPIKITTDFSTGTLKAREASREVFQALNENNFNPRILYPAKLSFKIDRAIKTFHHKQKLKQYMTTKPALQKILQGILHTEDESKQNHERKLDTSNHRRRKDKQSESSIDSAAHNQILKQQEQPNGRNHHMPININIECQWSQHPHQKIPFGKLD